MLHVSSCVILVIIIITTMAVTRAPKQWCLSTSETINSFENWKQNLIYTLTLDKNFSDFVAPDAKWNKYAKDDLNRGLAADDAQVPEANRRTADQKASMLNLMLGQIANFCPIIARNQIVRKSTSLDSIWQMIRAHFGFQSSGAHFLDLCDITLGPEERPEDLFQRLTAFFEDNLLQKNGSITHLGEKVAEDEDMSPSLENIIVYLWLSRLHVGLPKLVKQRYGTELRSRTLASLKPEISQALECLLDELRMSGEPKALRTAGQPWGRPRQQRPQYNPKSVVTSGSRRYKSCPLCKAAQRTDSHYLSECTYLPESDRKYLTRARLISDIIDNDTPNEEFELAPTEEEYDPSPDDTQGTSVRKVQVSQSPYLDVFYNHKTPRITLDTGATANLIRRSTAEWLGVSITQSSQSASQADGHSQLTVSGECKFQVVVGSHKLAFHGLVVDSLDVPILAGTPFMEVNDIHTRPAKCEVRIGDFDVFPYGSLPSQRLPPAARRALVLRGPSSNTTIWPGEYLELPVPSDLPATCEVAVEPRIDTPSARNVNPQCLWPPPSVLRSVSGSIRIPNLDNDPKFLRKNEQFCQVHEVFIPSADTHDATTPTPPVVVSQYIHHSDPVQIDPASILPSNTRNELAKVLRDFDSVFNPVIEHYNGAFGPFEAVVNMGPVQPPQRKGRLPQYNRDRLNDLQQKMDDLESKGVLVKPEDVGVTVEYLNPSFLVKKPSGGYRLVTAFGEVGQYSKPQPSLMPDVNSTLRTIGQWKFIAVTDLTSAFHQIPLSRSSIKYCGVATPFKGIRAYARCAMGMPGSETALEELMCRVLGNLLQEGVVAKIADDLYCGGNSPEELTDNVRRMLEAIHKSGLKLSANKTIICPKSVNILGWLWQDGAISASPHRIAALASCARPSTTKGLRSFIGAYKVLARVVPGTAAVLAPLEELTCGLKSSDNIPWSDDHIAAFHSAQDTLKTNKTVTLARPDDQLWIVTDAAFRNPGLGATLYVTRKSKLHLAGFFSLKLNQRQLTWLPCELEALAISAAIKHFSPFIIQSKHITRILTDSKPCVQAYERLCRGEFSASPRLTTFLSAVSRYQSVVQHLAGTANLPSDFASRNASPCESPSCQICSFVQTTSSSVLRLDISTKVPYANRTTWSTIQSECSDLRRTKAHLLQGTRPSKKATNIRDVKRYLNCASLSKDGLLVVMRNEPLGVPHECIIVPRPVLHGLLMSLHIQLNHPTAHQLSLAFQRKFYALDLPVAVSDTTNCCHQCASLRQVPHHAIEQSSSDPPASVGISFAADVMQRDRVAVLLIRETVTSYTRTAILPDQRQESLRTALLVLCLELVPVSGPPAVIRTDGAPGFASLVDDPLLLHHNIQLELGSAKNTNKNPVAEKAIQELESELLRVVPKNGRLNATFLAIATSFLNSRIRSPGFSARELWFHRDQQTNDRIPLHDVDIIARQHDRRIANHLPSETSKSHGSNRAPSAQASVGDIVYLHKDKSKTHGRDRYIVTQTDGIWCSIRKFIGSQLRNTSYRVKQTDIFLVPQTVLPPTQPANEEEHTDIDLDEPASDPNTLKSQRQIRELPPVPPQLSRPLSPCAHLPSPEPPDLVPLPTVTAAQPRDTVPVVDVPINDVLPPRIRRPPKYLDDYVTD